MATTLTDKGEITTPYFMSFPIERVEATPDGDLMVYGRATDGSVDHDQQIVHPDFSSKAIADWLATGGNIRVQHNPQRDPAGIGVEAHTDADGATWVKSLIVEPVAKRLVSKGALRAYSVGISNPTIERDVTGKARGGIIKAGKIVEISLVDRPANASCGFQLMKSVGDHAEYTGELFGSEGAIQKALGGDLLVKDEPVSNDVSDFDPMSINFTPQDLWRITQEKMARQHARRNGGYDPFRYSTVEKRDFDRGVGGGVDRDKLPDSDFAGPHRSFPIVTQSDVSDALHLVGHADDPAAVRARIHSIARRKGFSVPDEDSKKFDSGEEILGKGPGAVGGEGGDSDPMPGKKIPKPEEKDEDDIEASSAKEAEPDLTKEPEDNPEGKKVKDMDSDGDYDDAPGKAAKPSMKPKKGKKGKQMPPWLNKPADDSNKAAGCAEQHEHTDKCHTTPKEAGNVAEAADMQPAPVGELMESPAKPHMKSEGSNMDALMRLKTLGIDTDMGMLHDMTCPAFHPEEVAKVYPYADFRTLIDESVWQKKALTAATGRSISEAMEAQQAWQAAMTLKNADPADLNDYRMELHKAFRDANPGPTSFPSPCMMSPQKYNRPCITDGHAAYGSGYGGPNSSGRVATGAPNAHHFDRPPLGSGHQTPSPSFMKGGFEYPQEQGVPTRISYESIEKDKARRALSMMHDHLNHMFPSSCPMLDQDAYRQEENRTPPPAVKTVIPVEGEEVLGDVYKYIRKLEKKVRLGELTEAQARDKLAKRTAQRYAENLRRQVDKGMTSIEEVRKALGLEPAAPEPETVHTVQKAVGGTVHEVGTSPDALTPEIMKTMMTEILREHTQPLQERIEEQNKRLEELHEENTSYKSQLESQRSELDENRQRWEALADQPDPSKAAFSGLALNPAISGRPAGVVEKADHSERVQSMIARQLERTWRTSENPAEREAAYNALLRYKGMNE